MSSRSDRYFTPVLRSLDFFEMEFATNNGILSVIFVDERQHLDGRLCPRGRDIRTLTKVSLLQILWRLNQQGEIAPPESVQFDGSEVQNHFSEACFEMATFFATWWQQQRVTLVDQIQLVIDQRQLVA